LQLNLHGALPNLQNHELNRFVGNIWQLVDETTQPAVEKGRLNRT